MPPRTRSRRRRLEYLPVDGLAPHPDNPKAHADDEIAASVERFGYTEPMMVDERTGFLVVGHGRREQVIARRDRGEEPPDGVIVVDGEWRVPVIRGWASKDDTEARAYLIASNNLPPAGGWIEGPLATLLDELRTEDPALLAGTGFSADHVDRFLASIAAANAAKPADAATIGDGDDGTQIRVPPADKIRTRPGDIWTLGTHRLICGDARDPETYQRLLDGARVNVAFTSPPYADRRKYDETTDFRPIPPDDYVEWFAPVAACVADVLTDDGSWFVNIKPGVTPGGLDTELYVFDLVLAHVRVWGWHFATEFCWERLGVPKGVRRRFKNQYEPVYQFTRSDWKMRPENVRTPSSNVPVSLGEGSGNTAWDTRQGKGGVIGSDRRPRKTGTKQTMMSVQGTNTTPNEALTDGLAFPGNRIPSFDSSDQPRRVHKRPNTRTQSDVQGEGMDVNEARGDGFAYPGNRLPSFVGTHEATGHSAAFPVGLPAWFVRAFTDAGDVVLDPFAGSGSTLLACEREGRRGFGIEISPGYCDVAVLRWEKATGHRAKRLRRTAVTKQS